MIKYAYDGKVLLALEIPTVLDELPDGQLHTSAWVADQIAVSPRGVRLAVKHLPTYCARVGRTWVWGNRETIREVRETCG